MSLFSVMNVANRALHASQIGMDVTAQNMSNADVAGYSRKRVNLSAAYQRHTTFGQFGFGVDVLSVSRIRNAHIDAQIRRQSHELGMHREIDHVLESMENILREPSDTGILEYMNRFFNSWESLKNNPADPAARNVLRTNANMLCNIFHNVSAELDNLKATRNMEIVSVVNKINNIATEIFSLNGEISLVTLQGQHPNDSLDRRDQLMRELSELSDFEVQFAHDQQVTITINGNILVSPMSINRLEIFEDATTRTDPTANYNQFGVRMERGKNLINPHGGQLKGLMIARDETIPALQAQLDELARGLVQAVNAQHRLGFNLNGFSGFDFFDPTGMTAKTINLSASIQTNVSNIAAAGGTGSPIRATQNRIFSIDAFNPPTPIQLTRDGAPLVANENEAKQIFAGSVSVNAVSSGGGRTPLVENVHFRIDYSTGTITMIDDPANPNPYNDNISTFEIDFSYTSEGGFPGVGNNENAIAISELRRALTMNPSHTTGRPTATFDQFYGATIAELGLNRKEAMANINTREFLIGQFDAHQDSIAGVSLDEEMANLIKYQYTYQAAARIFSTAQSMLDILMSI